LDNIILITNVADHYLLLLLLYMHLYTHAHTHSVLVLNQRR